jgi:hypothetical protein
MTHVKSGGAVTVSWKVVVRVAAGFVVVPWIVTVVVPVGVLAAALTVSVTVAGLPDVGIAGFGAKLQVAPVGSPLEQLSVTDCANDPNAVTWNWAVFDAPSCTVTAPGEVRPKSTTCRVTGASCVSVPSVACALKL